MQIEYRCKAISLTEGDAETPLMLEYRYAPVTVDTAGAVLMEGQAVSGCVACGPETLETSMPIAAGGRDGATRTVSEMLTDIVSLIAAAGLLDAAAAAIDAAVAQPAADPPA